ncbi:TetR/AcrR family acrAB operon transcriptional repressor [Rhizobium petrolearium]|uniref:TetR/AcrR family transcriptional regulator n=2 Tax=Neorhizobium TaxID=1525371 RepID=A0ABV0MG70_9HYPH|nr:TetR/AcrR family transcriptional regulator [Neorhizobium petrolearium]MBP1848371.1 TetR/AcrR family acrAB operon transcriptional repressor [Neorhizobium petrolearium]MCC2614505.1 TetR/AcrR family transcriptional regulator [Neorhizobium petrolearium]WGI72266.1 TetR/AcrR family transcriptional regulator [Neorhizobium petrolearium]
MRRTKEQAAQTAEQILLAAENLFLEQGYDDVSLEEIAASANVTRGAVHWHFKNKQGLLRSMRRKALEPYRKLVDDLSENTRVASMDTLCTLISDMFRRIQAEPRYQGLFCAMARLDLTMAAKNEADGRTFREEKYALLVRIFELIEQESGLPDPWTPNKVASAFNASVSGLMLEWALGRGTIRLVPDGIVFVKALLGLWVNRGSPISSSQ